MSDIKTNDHKSFCKNMVPIYIVREDGSSYHSELDFECRLQNQIRRLPDHLNFLKIIHGHTTRTLVKFCEYFKEEFKEFEPCDCRSACPTSTDTEPITVDEAIRLGIVPCLLTSVNELERVARYYDDKIFFLKDESPEVQMFSSDGYESEGWTLDDHSRHIISLTRKVEELLEELYEGVNSKEDRAIVNHMIDSLDDINVLY